MENINKELEIGFYTGGKTPKPVYVYSLILDGYSIAGARTFSDIRAAKLSFNQDFKHNIKRYGFKTPTELREYLEKENRLVYNKIQIS